MSDAANIASRIIERIHAEAPLVVPPVFSTGWGREFFATKPVEPIGFSSEHIAGLLDLILDKTTSGKIAKTVFAGMTQDGSTPGKNATRTVGFPVEYIAELVDLILDKTISGKIAKTVFAEMAQSGATPAKIVKDLGLVQIQDEGTIRKVVGEVIAANPAQVAQYKTGKVQLFGFFVGQSMKAMQGKGNPEMINKILKETLG